MSYNEELNNLIFQPDPPPPGRDRIENFEKSSNEPSSPNPSPSNPSTNS